MNWRWDDDSETNFPKLAGEKITRVVGMKADSVSVDFYTESGKVFRLYHAQDCCETVTVADVAGDVSDLEGATVISAEVSTNRDTPPDRDWVESFTWTFYRIQTNKGHVTIRWLGESNGYYSEGVDCIIRVANPEGGRK